MISIPHKCLIYIDKSTCSVNFLPQRKRTLVEFQFEHHGMNFPFRSFWSVGKQGFVHSHNCRFLTQYCFLRDEYKNSPLIIKSEQNPQIFLLSLGVHRAISTQPSQPESMGARVPEPGAQRLPQWSPCTRTGPWRRHPGGPSDQERCGRDSASARESPIPQPPRWWSLLLIPPGCLPENVAFSPI